MSDWFWAWVYRLFLPMLILALILTIEPWWGWIPVAGSAWIFGNLLSPPRERTWARITQPVWVALKAWWEVTGRGSR